MGLVEAYKGIFYPFLWVHVVELHVYGPTCIQFHMMGNLTYHRACQAWLMLTYLPHGVP